MNTLSDEAVKALRSLPPPEQAELARLILALADTARTSLDAEAAAAIAEAEAEISRGERVPDDAIRAFWRSHGL